VSDSSSCEASGGALLAFLLPAFFVVTTTAVLMALRGTRKQAVISQALTSIKCVTIELFASLAIVVLLLIALIAWGGGCLKDSKDASDDVEMTGFGFLVFCTYR
jgi:hypothetical protein